jgi:hypothetical protein
MIVVAPPAAHAPAPEPVPLNTNCKYQVPVGGDAYECMSQAEYDAKQAADAQAVADANAWIGHHWYWFVIAALVAILLLALVGAG